MESHPVHDAAHHAFMTLPAYAIPREDEVKCSGECDKIAYLRHDSAHPQHEQENEGFCGACSCQRQHVHENFPIFFQETSHDPLLP